MKKVILAGALAIIATASHAGKIITEVVGEDGNTYVCTTIISGEYGVDLGCVLKE